VGIPCTTLGSPQITQHPQCLVQKFSATLPPNLTQLTLSESPCVDKALFEALPDSLRELSLFGVHWVPPGPILDFLGKNSKKSKESPKFGIASLVIRSNTRTFSEALSGRVGADSKPDDFLEALLQLAPPTLTRLDLEIWRGGAPLTLPSNLPWPKQIQYLSFPHAHIAISILLLMDCINLQSLVFSCISVSSAEELLLLPQLLSKPSLSHMSLSHIPIWVPLPVYEEITAIDTQLMESSAREEAEFFQAMTDPAALMDAEAHECLATSTFLAPIHNILRHMRIIVNPPLSQVVELSQINGFELADVTEDSSDDEFTLF
jgi:hypothetical protein